MMAHIIPLISAVVSTIAVLVAVIALLAERQQSRLALGATLLRDIEKEFPLVRGNAAPKVDDRQVPQKSSEFDDGRTA